MKIMKKSILAGALLMSAALFFVPADTAQAKEDSADGNIPLTAGYFPDEWLLKEAKTYDSDADGVLSPEEVAQVTSISCRKDVSDFSQIQYFTNLKHLSFGVQDEDEWYGVWAGGDLDLTVFPNLESFWMWVDSSKGPSKNRMIEIDLSGLEHLKSVTILDWALWLGDYDASRIRISVADLRDTPALESVDIEDVLHILMDEAAGVNNLHLWDVGAIPATQISTFAKLERLSIRADIPEFTSLDLSKCPLLTNLWIMNDDLDTLVTSGADSLQKMWIESSALTDMDVSANAELKDLQLDCSKLETLNVTENRKLEELKVSSERLAAVDVGNQVELTYLSLTAGRLEALDVGKNARLTRLTVDSDQLEALDVSRNGELEYLHVGSKRMTELNLEGNKKLNDLSLRCVKLSSLKLYSDRTLRYLTVEKTPLTPLHLSALTGLYRLYIYENTGLKKLVLPALPELVDLRVIGTKNLAKLDLSNCPTIRFLWVENTSLKSLSMPKQIKLISLDVIGNRKLTSLNLSKNKVVSHLKVTGNKKLGKLDLSNMKDLSLLADVSDNALKTLKIGTKKYMDYLNCSKNKLKTLDLSGATWLRELVCDKGVKVKGYNGEIKRI